MKDDIMELFDINTDTTQHYIVESQDFKCICHSLAGAKSAFVASTQPTVISIVKGFNKLLIAKK